MASGEVDAVVKNLCPECQKEQVVEPFATCTNCFAVGVVCMEAFMEIQRDHGTLKALASRTVIEKSVRSGWEDVYVAEYEAKLKQLEAAVAQ